MLPLSERMKSAQFDLNHTFSKYLTVLRSAHQNRQLISESLVLWLLRSHSLNAGTDPQILLLFQLSN